MVGGGEINKVIGCLTETTTCVMAKPLALIREKKVWSECLKISIPLILLNPVKLYPLLDLNNQKLPFLDLKYFKGNIFKNVCI